MTATNNTFNTNNINEQIILKITSQGQLNFPKKLIKSGQVKIGISYICSIDDGQIKLTERPNPFLKYRGIFKGQSDLTTEKFLAIRKSEAKL